MFFKRAQKSQYIWATFGRKFVAKNFKKSPNLVTLVVTLATDYKPVKLDTDHLGSIPSIYIYVISLWPNFDYKFLHNMDFSSNYSQIDVKYKKPYMEQTPVQWYFP